MKIFLISQTENTGYETYDSAVVCAPDESSARLIHPAQEFQSGIEKSYDSKVFFFDGDQIFSKDGQIGFSKTYTWASSPDKVTVKLIGDADPDMKIGVVCASYNAG